MSIYSVLDYLLEAQHYFPFPLFFPELQELKSGERLFPESLQQVPGLPELGDSESRRYAEATLAPGTEVGRSQVLADDRMVEVLPLDCRYLLETTHTGIVGW